jgi:hypothetical protein
VIIVDGKPLVDFSSYATSASLLVESVQRSGSFFIITCWCGDHLCAGIHQPVSVTHHDGLVFWVIKEPVQAEFTFDEAQYCQAVELGIHQVRQDIAELSGGATIDARGETDELSIVPGLPSDLELLVIKPRPKGQKRKSIE